MVFSCQRRSHMVIFENDMFSFAEYAPPLQYGQELSFCFLWKTISYYPPGPYSVNGNSHYSVLFISLREMYILTLFSSTLAQFQLGPVVTHKCRHMSKAGFCEKQLCATEDEVSKRQPLLVGFKEERDRLKKKRNKCMARLPDSWSPTKATEPLSPIAPNNCS